jgi:trk system potassium uptake protein TrkA
MKILIVGLGEVGSHLAKVLSADEGHRVTVVDTDAHRLKRVSEALDVKAVHGDGSRPDVLDRAGADAVHLLLAVANDDNVNMLTCLFAKRMGAKRTVLRIKDLTPFAGFRTFFRKNLQFDVVLSLEHLAAEEIVKSLLQNQAVAVENFADGKIQLRRLRLADGSGLLDVPLRDLKMPAGVLVAAIDREHEVLIPGGADALRAGDEVLVLGEPKGIASFEKKAGVRAKSLRSVVIHGAPGVTEHVCRALQRLGVGLRVIVEDRAEAEALSTRLSDVTVLHGEGTDLRLLQEERVGDADAFLSVVDADEVNLMSCQLARSLGVERTIALVQKPDYVTLYERLGVDVAISPRLLCANRILSLVRGGSVSTIATIEDGKAEVLEVEVKPGTRLAGKKLAEAGLPRGAVVGAIARETGEILIPRGDDQILPWDNLVVFAMKEVIDEIVEATGSTGDRE